MNTEQYIKEEWSDYPVSKLSSSDGLAFVKWLKENDIDEYNELVAKEAEDIAFCFLDAIFNGDPLSSVSGITMIQIGVAFRDLLKEKIEEYTQQADEDEDESELNLYLHNKVEADSINGEFE